jgi:hypothetical protein
MRAVVRTSARAISSSPERAASRSSTISLFGNPAYFNQTVYFCGSGDPLVAFPIANVQLAAAPKSSSASRFGYPGCVPTISANHTTNRSAWALESSATLHAYDATDLAHELYNSDQDASRDSLGSHVRFSVPTATGVPGRNDPPSTAITPVTADIGGQPATIEYFGVRTGFRGLCQVNLVVPQLSPGDYPVEIRVVASNTGTASVR